MIRQLCQDEDGLTTLEYALLLGLVAIAAVAAWTSLGTRVDGMVGHANTKLPS